jgi:pentatricopeptide repeat protein
LSTAYGRLGKRAEAQHEAGLAEGPRSTPPVEDTLLYRVVELKKNGSYLRNRATEALQAMRLGEAEKLFKQAIELDPNDISSRVGLLSLYGRKRQFDMAEKLYQEIRKQDPRAPQLDYIYAQVMASARRFDAALPAYRRALAINPYDAGLHNDVGLLLERRGQEEDSITHYRLAVKYDPGNRAALSNLGRALVRHKRFEEGMAYHLKALSRVDERTPKYLYVTALAYDLWGKRDKAIEYARQASSLASQYGQSAIAAAAEEFLTKRHARETSFLTAPSNVTGPSDLSP